MTELNKWIFIDVKVKGDEVNYFDYNEFSNVEKVGEGAFGSVNSADWKCCGIKIALKTLMNNNADIMNNFLKELNNLRKVSFHPNINRFYGVTKEPLSTNYILVLEYANQGNLRQYLKRNFNSLQWNDKIKMALDITRGLKCLHSRKVIHRDLHAKNILVHNNKLMIADFGLSKQLTETATKSIALGMPAYVDPQCYKNDHYKKDGKSDIYSLGVLLWEITSGNPPFSEIGDFAIFVKINRGIREKPIIGTPSAYANLYEKCWDDDPNKRPTIDDVFDILEKISLRLNTNEDNSKISTPVSSSVNKMSINNVEKCSLQSDTSNESNSKIMEDRSMLNIDNKALIDQSNLQSQSLIDIYELNFSSPLSSVLPSINENERELNNALDNIIQDYLTLNNIGWSENFSFNKFLANLEKYKSKSQEIFNYLINNPTIQHYEVMVGGFYNGGFGVDKNEDKAFEWYMKASRRNDINGHYEVGCCYYYGYCVEKNYEKAFEFYQLAANDGLNIALYLLLICYECSYNTKMNYFDAFEIYNKSAKNGFIPSQYWLAKFYEHGMGTKKDILKALKWYKLYQENDGGINVSDEIKNIELEQEMQDEWVQVEKNQEIPNEEFFPTQSLISLGVVGFVSAFWIANYVIKKTK